MAIESAPVDPAPLTVSSIDDLGPPEAGPSAETTTEVMATPTASDIDRIWTQIRNLQTMMVNAGVIRHYEVGHIFERVIGAL